ncbi:hypothetical protein [Leptospira vanthielii]|uniref:Lipoprotein n=1 Tax=Leptospira vanthielii serovar Holland str. Waz Holland = ATCC 700522 TaxID=1218591 RepID=N1WIG3_9LEPT|nr:hypothetical protein [Leptospira vanthielii]EMY71671.1 hypothetical protein LEP1GSC199_0583 [Leptospira vanthielii serovar Holland str. Waz Holland = ATCC 700522]
MKKILTLAFALYLASCTFSKHTFQKANTNFLKKIDNSYNEYVIHIENKFNGRSKKNSLGIYSGIIDSLKKCSIQNKRIYRYIGFSKFLNNSSESLQILSDEYQGNQPKRIDLHLILDDEESAGDLYNNSDQLSKHSSSKYNSKKLHNYNLYHYSITNPLINFEFIENIEYVGPSLNNNEPEEYLAFGKILGTELCEALKSIN